ncbi:hypothetical protein [Marinibactrum halimedae]|uniref:hypothetical protein n=1 Tax=Marinibactrum halimedae TaxID=1444977 RepID=UPI001E4290F4|nr:hypothetical protein [Marinibactrum halimedae]MCD9458437.1 hypothetical protein [Marinibactrum halimedae]
MNKNQVYERIFNRSFSADTLGKASLFRHHPKIEGGLYAHYHEFPMTEKQACVPAKIRKRPRFITTMINTTKHRTASHQPSSKKTL